jgi:hypothetical protein
MRSSRLSFAHNAARIAVQARSQAAVALALVVIVALTLIGAAAAGAFATTAKPASAGAKARTGAAAAERSTAQRRGPAQRRGREGPARSAATSPARTTRPAASARVMRPATAARATRPVTSCGTVGHIGDSTSVGMVSPADLPDPAQRLAAQYAGVGVRHLRVDASGGRSIVEALPGQVNGYDVARTWSSQGFRGCWVFALGTNDTANVSAGSNVGLMTRIANMMAVAHGQPVMWVNTRTLLSAGPYSEANMQAWNDDLLQACAAYPNMRIFNWAGLDQPGWHIPDGIHYTPAGYAVRAQDIARALAHAFPRSGPSSGCVVS